MCIDAWNCIYQTYSLLPGRRLILLLLLLDEVTLRLLNLGFMSVYSLTKRTSSWIRGRIQVVCDFPADAFDGFLKPYQ